MTSSKVRTLNEHLVQPSSAIFPHYIEQLQSQSLSHLSRRFLIFAYIYIFFLNTLSFVIAAQDDLIGLN